MDELNDKALQKLRGIQRLWLEIGRTKLGTPEYNALIEKIRSESAEYEALVDAATTLGKPLTKPRPQ